jgi:AcrR family transcriptional regulator
MLLEAARMLLVEQGPGAVTLKAVAQRLGMTHGNVTHHFGTSAALHAALVEATARQLAREAHAAVLGMRHGEVSAEEIVDMFFDVFASSGLGKLLGWLAASGVGPGLTPILDVIADSVRALREGEPSGTDPHAAGAGPIILNMTSHALTAALIGERLEQAADMPRASLRRLAAEQLRLLRASPRS